VPALVVVGFKSPFHLLRVNECKRFTTDRWMAADSVPLIEPASRFWLALLMNLFRFPLLAFVLTFLAQWFSAQMGNFYRAKKGPMPQDDQSDFGIVEAATLTLLGLIIGFSFSMAITRYDQRKNYEAAEANAIGTEYLRADVLPGDDAALVRELLKKYIDLRVQSYTVRDTVQLSKIDTDTADMQNELWSAVRHGAEFQPTPVVALAVSGMNDVLDSQGYTQAAWWNTIPVAAWILMMTIAICCNLLIGYGAHRKARGLLSILPLVISISFFFMADIDTPRSGIIRVVPQNLLALSQSLHPR